MSAWLAPADVHATPTKCRAAIVQANAAFVAARANALQRCEDAKVRGKLAAGTVCTTEPHTAPALDKARVKLGASIAKGCGGKNRICGGINAADDDALADVGWAIGSCKDFETRGCTNAIASCGDIPVCLACIGEAAVDQALGLSYGAFQPSSPKSHDKAVRALNKCQATIGRFATTLLTARAEALARCWDAVNAAGGGTCPDARATSAIGKAQAKMAAAITRSCRGADKKAGTADDFAPSTIGFVASCPTLAPVGQASCGATVDGQQALVSCLGCVGAFATDCPDRAAVPGFVSPYPTECNPPPPPPPPPPLPECTAQRTVHIVAGNGSLAWFTLVWPVPQVIASPNAAYSYDDVAKAAVVPGTGASHPLYARLIGSRTLWAGVGTHPDPSIFVASTNQTHTNSPSSTTITSGPSVVAAGAALQTGLAAPVPVVSLRSGLYGTAPGAPAEALVSTVDGAVAAVASAASLSPAEQADLAPSDATLATWGINAGTNAALATMARTLLFAANAFRLGLVATVVLPGFNDDPHGAFTDVPGTTARADGLTAVLDGFYAELAAHDERDCGHGGDPVSLADNTVLVVSGDTFKDPFNRNGWSDGTPGNSNLLYVRSNGWLKPGWFGALAPSTRTNFDPNTGEPSAIVTASSSTIAAQLGIVLAISRGSASAVAAVSSAPYAGVVAAPPP